MIYYQLIISTVINNADQTKQLAETTIKSINAKPHAVDLKFEEKLIKLIKLKF